MTTPKQLARILPSPPKHWVGNGFHVSSVLSPQVIEGGLSPYILMDYGAPARFEPSERPRGVGTHPHRGFETVTVVYSGEVEHRDSAGNSGRIGPGDVQWMTAAAGVLHEEFHSREFTRRGGEMEMAQLWVNLPARHKMSAPRYQEIAAASIPVVKLSGSAGSARIIAGEFRGTEGAAETFTPVVLWDVRLGAGAEVELPLAEGFNAALFVRRGALQTRESRAVKSGELALLSRQGEGLTVRSADEAELLVLGGEPIDEPVVQYGPFVMTTEAEIEQAIEDFRSGRFGPSG